MKNGKEHCFSFPGYACLSQLSTTAIKSIINSPSLKEVKAGTQSKTFKAWNRGCGEVLLTVLMVAPFAFLYLPGLPAPGEYCPQMG